jgi:aspartate aminotransferase-like enzyme
MAEQNFPYRLLTPGPVPLPESVLSALAEPVRHHRTPEFMAIFARVSQGLKWFFSTRETVLVLTSTGTGAMEAALVNTLSPEDNVLCLISGKFGERWAEMAERFGLKVHRITALSGNSIDLDQLAQHLKKDIPYKAVLMQAVETSTATMNDVQEISKLVHAHTKALLMVDAITGLGAMELNMDDDGLDVVIGGSQKALMLPTGLSFIALSKRAWAQSQSARLPRYYFDLTEELKAQSKSSTHFSSANSHIVALDVVLKEFQKRGLNWLIGRTSGLAEATRHTASALGLKIFSKTPAGSVTAIEVPKGVDGVGLRNHLEQKYNVTVMGGQDELQGRILRLGHLGYITNEDAIQGMVLLTQSLLDLGCKTLPANATALAQEEMRTHLSRVPQYD